MSHLILFYGFVILLQNTAEASWTKQKDDELKVQLGVVIPRYNFEIKAPKELSSSVARFEPHAPSKTAVSFSYRNLGLGLSTSNPTTPEEELKFGTSKSQDYQLRFFGKRSYEFFYQSYEGYYIKNSEDLDSSYIGRSDKIQRPDIRSRNFGLNFLWSIHEKDFSQAIAFDQAGRQTGSGWGVSWLVHASDSRITGDREFLPTGTSAQFGVLSGIDDIHRKTLATGVGLGGIATTGSFYVTSFIGLGVGYQNLEVRIPDLSVDNTSDTVGAYSTVRMGLGFNGEKNVLGTQFIMNNVSSGIAGGEINGNTIELSLFYAYRFSGVSIPFLNPISGWLD